MSSGGTVWADDFWADDFWAADFWSTEKVVGHAITNDNATPAHTNQEICDRTGFRVYPGELVRNWDGVYTRIKSLDVKPPQLLIRSVPDQQKGSPSPESADVFVGANEVTIDDL